MAKDKFSWFSEDYDEGGSGGAGEDFEGYSPGARRKPGRPKGTTKISGFLQLKYEFLIAFLRYLARRQGVPQHVVNKVFYLLEDPTFINYSLRSIEKIAKLLVTKSAKKLAGKAFKAATKAWSRNPALPKPLLGLAMFLLRSKTIQKVVAIQFLEGLAKAPFRKKFLSLVATFFQEEAKRVGAGAKDEVKAAVKRVEAEFGKALKKVKNPPMTLPEKVVVVAAENPAKKKKKAKAKATPPKVGRAKKLHIIYPKVHDFDIKLLGEELRVTPQYGCKIYGIEGGSYCGGLLIAGPGVEGFPKEGPCKLLNIRMQKGAKSNFANMHFKHLFTTQPNITIHSPQVLLVYKKGKRLYKEFEYED